MEREERIREKDEKRRYNEHEGRIHNMKKMRLQEKMEVKNLPGQ